MYFPSPLPTTRLSVSTSAVPSAPSPLSRNNTTLKSPNRHKNKFKDFLGGLQEEEGEQVLDIVRGPLFLDGEGDGDGDGGRQGPAGVWAVLGREDVSIWCIRPKVVLAKLLRTSISLRTHGPNSSLSFHSTPSRSSRSSHLRIIITTTTGHQLLYSLLPATSIGSSAARRSSTATAYVLPGGEKANANWPRGPGEGRELEGIILREEGVLSLKGLLNGSMNNWEEEEGTWKHSSCVTEHSLLVSIQTPPSLLVVPFPVENPNAVSPSRSKSNSSSSLSLLAPVLGRSNSAQGSSTPPVVTPKKLGEEKWEELPSGWENGTENELISLESEEWEWLVRGRNGEVPSITCLTPLPIHNSFADQDLETTPVSKQKRRPQDFILLASDGRAYLARWSPVLIPTPPKEKVEQDRLTENPTEENEAGVEPEVKWAWHGVCFHPNVASTGAGVEEERQTSLEMGGNKGTAVGVNIRIGLVAVGCESGTISVYNLYPTRPGQHPTQAALTPVSPTLSHLLSLRKSLNSTASGLDTGKVTCLSWTSDGYALAAGWALGWSVWSVYGRLGSWSIAGSLSSGYGVEGERSESFEDHFMHGVRNLFWSPGNLELFVLCPPPIHPKQKPHDEQLFVIPFAKSAVTAVHTPDNTKHGFLQMDDRVLVYRGADQPDMSVINPESDVWQHIKLPASYIALHHPIRYAVISSDARLIAVAGRRGLTHYNALSGRWKLFEFEEEEESIRVVGGMAWWSNVLIVGCVESGVYQLRVFARDQPLSLVDSLEAVALESSPLLLAVFDSSLLVYTADNTLHHFLIRQTRGGVTRLKMCGSIGFEGVVTDPRKVRGMSWLVPKSQQRFGDPADDLNVATIIFLINGSLVLLRPRRSANEEVKYDLQILADRIEFYWTHLSGIGTLENSLWGWDGNQIRIWLDALTIEKVKVDEVRDAYESVTESVGIPLDFYPLAVLMEKGIIVGVDQETSLRRSLDFAIFRIITTTHLFIHHVLRFHLTKNQRKEAVLFASHYQHLVYFAHALEILLHDVLEDEADSRRATATPPTIVEGEQGETDTLNFAMSKLTPEEDDSTVLPRVVEFLDHFDEALQVVVGCARKTEVARWPLLFNVVGKPRELFEKCIAAGFLKVAASYLLVLHHLEPLEQSSKDIVRLLKAAMDAREWMLCRELLRFLYSLDRSGLILRTALGEGSALPPGYTLKEVERDSEANPQRSPCVSLALGTLLGRVVDPFSGGSFQLDPARRLSMSPSGLQQN